MWWFKLETGPLRTLPLPVYQVYYQVISNSLLAVRSQFVNNCCFPGSPPLWLTKMGSDCFVGGAKIIMRNLQANSNLGRKQRLHIIDHVLEPLTPVNSDNSQGYIDLTAGKLLRESETYKIPKHTIR